MPRLGDIEGYTLAITGGAGSYGRAVAKAALSLSPKSIRILDNSEWGLWDFEQHVKDERLRFMYADVRDRERLRQLFKDVDVVIHAAALKHVPCCEYNPAEAIKTNALGSLNVVDMALECGVGKVLGISSDKAVHPINTYGATKLVMERLFCEAMNYSKTKFSCVRFGNFWPSNGSVFELWDKQKPRGEITITDKDMSRYWIHIDEAVAFTFQCLDMMEGGEIFIPVMRTHTLSELANMVAPECQVKIIGKRRGEKKHEELYSADEERFIERRGDCLIIRSI